MKKLYLLALLLCTSVFAQSQQLAVGFSGNGYITRQQDGAQITEKELRIGQILTQSLAFIFICINPRQLICHYMPKDILKSKSVMERIALKSIYNQMTTQKFL